MCRLSRPLQIAVAVLPSFSGYGRSAAPEVYFSAAYPNSAGVKAAHYHQGLLLRTCALLRDLRQGMRNDLEPAAFEPHSGAGN